MPEPTNTEALAAAAGLALHGRRLLDALDLSDPVETIETLAALREMLALIGGSALGVADALGISQEVETLVERGKSRLAAYEACEGMEGHA